MISCISGFQEGNAILGIQDFFYTVKSLKRFAGLFADACKNAEALGLNEDLALFSLV